MHPNKQQQNIRQSTKSPFFEEMKKIFHSFRTSSNSAHTPSSTWNRLHFRLCHLQRNVGESYGFTICAHENNGTRSHIISKLKQNSPAAMSGLLSHDRLIEVNGCNVEHENVYQIENRVLAGLHVRYIGDSKENDIDSNFSKSTNIIQNPLNKISNHTVDSVSSNDSGLVETDEVSSKAPINDEDTIDKNECLLLVLDPRSYLTYIQDRAKFISEAPVIYMKPSSQNDKLSEMVSCNTSTNDKNSQILDDFRSSLLTSSNDSFDYMESRIDSSNEEIIGSKLSDPTASDLNVQTDIMQLPFEEYLSPRLCYLKKKSALKGYGFNLISPMGSKIQMIGKVENHSPADFSGLRNDDIVIEVNGVNVLNENHREVVTRITEGVIRNGQRNSDEVILLVVTPAAKEWYDSRGISINCKLPNIVIGGECPTTGLNQQISQLQHETSFRESATESNPHSMNFFKNTSNISTKSLDKPVCKATIEVNITGTPARKYNSINQVPSTVRNAVLFSSGRHKKYNGLNLDMSVAEIRELLRQRSGKRSMNARYNNLSLKEKYNIVQNM